MVEKDTLGSGGARKSPGIETGVWLGDGAGATTGRLRGGSESGACETWSIGSRPALKLELEIVLGTRISTVDGVEDLERAVMGTGDTLPGGDGLASSGRSPPSAGMVPAEGLPGDVESAVGDGLPTSVGLSPENSAGGWLLGPGDSVADRTSTCGSTGGSSRDSMGDSTDSPADGSTSDSEGGSTGNRLTIGNPACDPTGNRTATGTMAAGTA